MYLKMVVGCWVPSYRSAVVVSIVFFLSPEQGIKAFGYSFRYE